MVPFRPRFSRLTGGGVLLTHSNGEFQLAYGEAAGFAVKAAGYLDGQFEVTLHSSDSIEVALQPIASTGSVLVTDGGVPVPSAAIGHFLEGKVVELSRTDVSGKTTISGTLPKLLFAWKESRVSPLRLVHQSELDEQFEFQLGDPWHIEFYDDRGESVDLAIRLMIATHVGGSVLEYSTGRSAKHPLWPGAYRMLTLENRSVVSQSGTRILKSSGGFGYTIRALAGDRTEIVVTDPNAMAITLRDAVTRKTLTNASGFFYYNFLPNRSSSRLSANPLSMRTDGQGRFTWAPSGTRTPPFELLHVNIGGYRTRSLAADLLMSGNLIEVYLDPVESRPVRLMHRDRELTVGAITIVDETDGVVLVHDTKRTTLPWTGAIPPDVNRIIVKLNRTRVGAFDLDPKESHPVCDLTALTGTLAVDLPEVPNSPLVCISKRGVQHQGVVEGTQLVFRGLPSGSYTLWPNDVSANGARLRRSVAEDQWHDVAPGARLDVQWPTRFKRQTYKGSITSRGLENYQLVGSPILSGTPRVWGHARNNPVALNGWYEVASPGEALGIAFGFWDSASAQWRLIATCQPRESVSIQCGQVEIRSKTGVDFSVVVSPVLPIHPELRNPATYVSTSGRVQIPNVPVEVQSVLVRLDGKDREVALSIRVGELVVVEI